ncbi:MAG: Gfo/Idh/MocA family protein [Bacteroidota bacterium]
MQFMLIGCGIWGNKILRELLDLGANVQVIDSNMDAQKAAQQMGAQNVSHKLKFIGSVDAVIVATEASSHADIIFELDELGYQVPIFCEKPLTDTSQNAQRLLDRKGYPIYVMHIWRYHSGIQKLKQLYDDGIIGHLTQIHSIRTNWTSPRKDVDSLSNLAPHDLSIIQYVLGELPELKSAHSEIIDNELVGCIAILKNENQPTCIFEISNRYAEKRREVRLHGENGVLVLPDDSQGVIQLIKGPGHIIPDKIETYSYEKTSALKYQMQIILKSLQSGNVDELCSLKDGTDIIFCIDNIRENSY